MDNVEVNEVKEEPVQLSIVKRILWMFIVVAILIGFDQVTKKMAQDTLRGAPTVSYLNDTIQLKYVENKGAWGGLGDSLSEEGRIALLIVLPTLFLIILAIYVIRQKEYNLTHVIAFSFILGGGLGNMVDRIAYGAVVDFMYMGIGKIGTNIFNVADVSIVIGTILIFFLAFKTGKKPEKNEEKNEA